MIVMFAALAVAIAVPLNYDTEHGERFLDIQLDKDLNVQKIKNMNLASQVVLFELFAVFAICCSSPTS